MPGGGGDFSFKASQPLFNSDHVSVDITAVVGLNHLLYRNEIRFSAEAARVEVDWPQHQTKPDPFTAEMVDVYATGNHAFKIRIYPQSESARQNIALKVEYQGCSNLTCFFPTSRIFDFKAGEQTSAAETSAGKNSPASSSANAVAAAQPQDTTGKPRNQIRVETPGGLIDFANTLEEKGLFWVLLLSLLGGLLVSLTPCVYPMIPITLSIIGGRDENRSFIQGLGLSATYVAGLSLTYAFLGLAAATFGAQIRGLLQGTFFQALIAIIFFILALSMFDVFMIQAPAALRNRLGNVKKTGLAGIFVMGMVSGLMASPCVAAPLAGILAFIAATGSQILGFFMLLLFAWGMSVPLLLIGAFSGSLNAMPRAGEWMNRVKEFYGFLMLGAALYFVQPLIGESWAELLLAMVLAAFAAYLGLFSNLPEDAALGPRVFKAFAVITIAVACAFAISATTKWGYLCMPQSLSNQPTNKAELFWYQDFEAALRQAGQQKKPIFIDFRADWCTICRELEEKVFPRPEISVLLEKMILLKIDATRPDERIDKMLKDYAVVGLPTLVLLTPDGREKHDLRMVGDISPQHLARQLSSALQNY